MCMYNSRRTELSNLRQICNLLRLQTNYVKCNQESHIKKSVTVAHPSLSGMLVQAMVSSDPAAQFEQLQRDLA